MGSIPDTLPANFAGFDDAGASNRRAGGVPDTLPAEFDKFDSAGSTVIPFRPPAPRTTPTEAASKVGRPMIKLAPPAADITQVPRNVFTGGARIPGMPTQEEIAANGTVSPQPDVTLPGPHGTPIKLKQSDIETAGKVFLPGMNPDATLQGSAPIVSPERGIVAAQNLMTEKEQKQHPFLTGLGQLGEGLTTPENLAILAGTAGFGELPAAARAGLSAYFAAQMAEGVAGYGVQGWKAYKRGDTGEAKRLWTLAAGSAVMGGAAGAHAIRETPFAPKVGAEPVVPKGTISEPLARDAAITPERAAQIGSESVKPAKAPAGAIGPKEEPLAPEKPETLKAQVDALKRGTNKTVYFPKGTENLPAPPENAIVTVAPGEKAGAGTWYHTKDVKPVLILKKVQDGTFGELLGNHQPKEVALAGESPTAVVARDPGGTEVKASLVDGSKPEVVAAQAATLQRQFPKADISVEKPEDVIHERLGTTPKEAEKPTAAPVSRETPATERRSQVRDLGGPDFMRTTRLNQLRTELAGELPAEDRAIMQRQYDDMIAHPFEKHEGGDINAMKAATKPTLTRAEAEAATEQRKAGRNKRFGIPGSAAVAPADIQPRIAEIAPEFHDLATKVDQIDPSLAKDLRAVANGEIHKPEHLEAIAGRVKDADTKAELTKAAQDYRAASSPSENTARIPAKDESQAASVLAIHGQAEGVRETAPQNRRKLGIPGKKAFRNYAGGKILRTAKATFDVTYLGRNLGSADNFADAQKLIDNARSGKYPVLSTPKHSPEVLEQAKQEIRAASELASTFERPGRYFAEHGDQNEGMPSRSTNAAKGIHAGGTWYGVSSSKHIVADQYPWFEKMKGAGGKLAELAGKEKGAEYDRLVNTVAEHILRERESAAPVVAEFAPKLKSLADEIDGHDEELSSTLAELAKGDGRGFKNLREYIGKKVNDAEQARDFYRLIDAAAKEAREASVEEPAVSSAGLRAEESVNASKGTQANAAEGPAANSEFLKAENVKKQTPAEKQNALPGFESALEQLKAATETVRGEKLTEEVNRPLGNIDNAAGEMERNSPLFRGTAASPQNEMFEGPTAAVGDRVQVNAGALEGKSVEVTKVGDSGIYVRGEEGPVKFVKNGDFGPLLDVEGQPLTTGPGTPLAGHLDTSGTRIEQLAQVIKENAKGTTPVTKRIDLATQAAAKMSSVKDASVGALNKVKSVAAAMLDAYRRPVKWTGFEDSLGKYQGALQKSAFELRGFAKSLRDAIPSKLRREAIANWVEAAGDEGKLKEWASKSKGSLKAGYEEALKLNDTEKTIARNLIASQDERFQLDREAGLIEHEVENYVMHAWKRENPYTKELVSTVRAEMLKPNPSFARKRVFGTYFDGEQAGFTPAEKDIGFLFAAREHAANEAVAARAFIRSLLEGRAKDGRPLAEVSGSGHPIVSEEAKLFEDNPQVKAYVIDSRLKPEEVADYRPINHPALRKWTWATNDAEGRPIYVRGDIVVHPEAYGQLKNVLSKSALRSLTIPGTDVQPFRIALRLGSEFKNTMLSFSGFHQTQEGLHAIFHKVNPFTTKAIDFSDPTQMKLVEHGLQVASFDAQQEFGEGLTSGLTQRIPVIGKYFQKYNDYLFSDLIPRLKMTLAQEALQRNRQRFSGKLSEDQIYATTANQANAAFGELNYKMMARNQTLQDVLRMSLLAPDFLEARGRFVGQAVKPYGREQAYALIRGAVGLYVGARIVNQILDKDPHWAAQDAFSVVYKGRSFTLRSVPGDILHLFTDPRGFVYNRLNPIYGKGAMEALTGRDQYGRKQDIGQQAKDLIRGGIPIPFQGFVKNLESGPLETIASSTGVSTTKYYSPAERLARQFTIDKSPLGPADEDRKDANKLARNYEDKLRKKEMTKEQLAQERASGKITLADQQAILARAARTPLQNSFRSLDAAQALQVWDKATPAERQQVRPLLANKLSGLDKLQPTKRAELRSKILEALHPSGDRALVSTTAPRHFPIPSAQ